MNNFKIGDTVRRVHTWDASGGLPGGEVGVVSVLHGNTLVEVEGCGDWWHLSESLELVEQVDDTLPPAPESVRYATMQYEWQGTYNDQHLTVSRDTFTGALAMHMQGNTHSTRNKDMSLSVLLDADDALNLAHDLTRMAMEIKRKEKQHG